MIEKDKTIINFLKKIKLFIDNDLIQIEDFWESDLCAIGLKKENKLIYISTYNYLNSKEPLYDYDLEILDEFDRDKFEVVKRGRIIPEHELITEMKAFFVI